MESTMRTEGEVENRSAMRIPCEVYSRIVGYLRPVQNWHHGKQQEFHERKVFRLPETLVDIERGEVELKA